MVDYRTHRSINRGIDACFARSHLEAEPTRLLRQMETRNMPRPNSNWCRRWLVVVTLLFTSATCLLSSWARAEESEISPLDDDGRLVQFERDVAPILRDRCLECHGAKEPKNDFRVDDVDSLMEFIEPEDWESSSVFVDYLTIDDEDLLMPPKSHGGPLSPGELALIRVWIEEGAVWPDGFELKSAEQTSPTPAAEPVKPASSLPERVWAFQGFLHPATVHFPIALLLLGGLFVVLGWKWPAIGYQVPLACLLVGAPAAIAAAAMGWSFAPERGYGSWDRFDLDSEVFWHRWSGVAVAVLATLLAVIALISLRRENEKLTRTWKIGLLAVAAMVGAVGHQGGEMSFGKDFYPKAFRVLLGTPESPDVGQASESVKDGGSESVLAN